jgi:hypothetical protein
MAALEDPDKNSSDGDLSFGDGNKNFRITDTTSSNRSLSMSMWYASRRTTADLDRGYSARSSSYDHELQEHHYHLSISGLPFLTSSSGGRSGTGSDDVALSADPDAVEYVSEI